MSAHDPFEREAQALEEMAATAIAAPVRGLLIGTFLLALVLFPVTQALVDLQRDGPALSTGLMQAWQSTPEPDRGFFPLNARAQRAISTYETRLQRESFAARQWIPTLQRGLLPLGLGNEQAYIGREGWLFYRPAVEHLTGPGFLESDQLARRAAGGDAWTTPPQPDPRQAILQLRKHLSAHDIDLVLVPAPAKAAVEPEYLASGEAHPLLRNASTQEFLRWADQNGIEVVDVEALLHGRPDDQFLPADTHWTFDAMDQVAQRTAELLGNDVPPSPRASRTPRTIRARGDIADTLLQLGEPNPVPEHTQTLQVPPPMDTAMPYRVLLLGDSYSNIFRMPELGWGADAGFPEQLAWYLDEPVLAFTRNDGGAHASRNLLANALRKSDPRLAHIEVVVWEFAAREWSFGDWKLMDYALFPEPQETVASTNAAQTAGTTLQGNIVALSKPPVPGTVPYRDCLVQVVVQTADGEVMLQTHGMRDNQWTAAANWGVGDTLDLTTVPWGEVAGPRKLEAINVELVDDPDATYLFLDVYWTETKAPDS